MPLRTASRLLCGSLALGLFFAAPRPAHAVVIPLTAADFAGTSLITFTGIPDGTVVNSMVVDGVLFNYLVNGVASDFLIVDGGPGVTNNVSPPNLVNSGGNAGAVLRLTFAQPEERLGYGFAVLNTVAIANATTVSLFDATNAIVGVLSANGVPDPLFTGGFLGLRSTVPFVRADITFSTLGGAFAFDNLRFAPAATVPEPAGVALLLAGLAGVAQRWRRRS